MAVNPITNVLRSNSEEISLPPDPSQWTGIVIQTVTEKYPETAPYIMDVIFIKADENNAIGYVTIYSEDARVDLPVIIRNRKLLPIDLMIVDKKLTYANPRKLYDALQGNKLFAGTAGIPKQPDIGGGALAPQSGSRALLEKVSSLTNRTKLLKLANILNQHKREVDKLRVKYPHFNEILDVLQSRVFPDINKLTEVFEDSIDRPVIQIRKDAEVPGKFTIIMNSQKIWNPIKIKGDYTTLHKIAEKYNIDSKKFIEFIAAHQTVTLNFGKTYPVKIASIDFITAKAGDSIITYSPERKLKLEGKVFQWKDIKDDKTIDKGYIFISDKWFDVSFDEPFAAITKLKKNVHLKEHPIALPGRYYFIVIDDKYAFGPWQVVTKEIDKRHGYTIIFDGLDKKYKVVINNSSDHAMVMISDDESNIRLPGKSVKLIEVTKKTEVIKCNANILKQAKHDINKDLSTCIIRYDRQSKTFSIEGPYLDRIIKGASIYYDTITFDLKNLTWDEATFILSHRYKPSDAGNLLKLAMQHSEVYINDFYLPSSSINEMLKKASYKGRELLDKFNNLIMPWQIIKIAIELNDATTLDSIFSLSLAAPENMAYLIEGLPILEEAESILAKYLLMARLGGIDYPEDELKILIDEFDKFLSYVKELKFAFQG